MLAKVCISVFSSVSKIGYNDLNSWGVAGGGKVLRRMHRQEELSGGKGETCYLGGEGQTPGSASKRRGQGRAEGGGDSLRMLLTH